MSKSINSLKSYGKAFKVKLPKEPYFLMSYSLRKEREELMKYLRNKVDNGGGSKSVIIPMDNSEARLSFENGCYYLSSDRFGKVELNELSTGFLGEQLFYSIEAQAPDYYRRSYESKFDNMEGLQEEWMHFMIANKEKRFTLNSGVPLLFSGYAPGGMEPGNIYAVYEKDGEHYVCVEGQEDIYWFDLNIDTKVSLCDELYREFIPQAAPQSVEDALTLWAFECKNRSGKSALASNVKTPLSILSILSEDKNEDVRKDLSRNRNASAEILAKLTEDTSTAVRENVAGHPNTPASCLAKLAEDREMVNDFGRQVDASVGIRQAVAENPNTPAESLAKLADDPNLNVRLAAAKNPNTPFESFVKLANDPELNIRLAVAGNPNTPASFLAKLAEVREVVIVFEREIDTGEPIRRAVAGNPNTPVETLSNLAEDPAECVRIAVSHNPNSPTFRPATEIDDGRDSEKKPENDRENPVIDTSIPSDVLAKMAFDPNTNVRAKAAENPNTPVDCLELLSRDIMWDVIERVGKNPSTPLDVLLNYANKEEKYMMLVVNNPSFPLASLLDMAGMACYFPKSFPLISIVRALLNRL